MVKCGGVPLPKCYLLLMRGWTNMCQGVVCPVVGLITCSAHSMPAYSKQLPGHTHPGSAKGGGVDRTTSVCV